MGDSVRLLDCAEWDVCYYVWLKFDDFGGIEA